jgi:AcrR family transcriptional regulator
MEKVKEILAAALTLFVEYGFHGAPTTKIAKLAGVANGTLFHYFATKEDLIISLYIDVKTRLALYLEQRQITGDTLKTQIKSRFVHVMYWSLENDTEFKFIQQFHTSPFLARFSAEEMHKQLKPDLDLIEAGIAAKIIKSLPIDLILTLLLNHIYGINLYMINAQLSEADRDKLIEDSFEMLWGMIT